MGMSHRGLSLFVPHRGRRNVTAYIADFSGAGALGDGWSGTFVRDGSGNVNPVLTESANLLTNGNFETGTLGGWDKTVTGDADFVIQGADVHGGSYAMRGNVGSAGEDPRIDQDWSMSKGTWYRADWWIKYVGSSLIRIYLAHLTSTSLNTNHFTITNSSWAKTMITNIATVDDTATFRAQVYASSGDYGLFDDLGLYEISDFAAYRNVGQAHGRIVCAWTGVSKVHAGVVFNWQDEDNYAALVGPNRNNELSLIELSGGNLTITNSWTYTPVAAGELIVDVYADGTLDVTYDSGVLVTGQALSNPLSAKQVGMIGLHDTIQFHSFAWYPTPGG